MTTSLSKTKTKWWWIALLPVLALWVVIYLALSAVFRASLSVIIWTSWSLRGRDVLFVYSDSPIWHDYIKEHFLAQFAKRAVVLNWSQRKNWRFSLARVAFDRYGGSRDFNPVAIVFRPFRTARIFRFRQPFMECKKGQPAALHVMERDLFALLGVQPSDASSLLKKTSEP